MSEQIDAKQKQQPKSPANEPEPDNSLHIVLLGPVTSKTSCILRLLHDSYEPRFDPTIEETYKYELDGEELTILDTASGEEYGAMRPQYIFFAHSIILMFRVDDELSFAEMESYFELIRRERPNPPPVVLVGSKADCPSEYRKVTKEQAQEYAAWKGVPYFEVSAKTGQGVREMFQKAARLARRALDSDNENSPATAAKKHCTLQ